MKSFCVIGLGRYGFALAETLASAGKEVLVIDTDEKNIADIADTVDIAVQGDATQEAVLRAAGVGGYDCAVVCMSENVNDSVLTVILLKELGVKRIIARAGNERHAKVLEKLGVDEIIFPETDYGRKMGRLLSFDSVQQYMEFSEDTTIIEFEVPKQWIGKNLLELDIRKKYEVNVLTVRRPNSPKKGIMADPKAKFSEGDLVTVIGLNKDIAKLIEHLHRS